MLSEGATTVGRTPEPMDYRLQAAVLAIARDRDWEREALTRWPIIADRTQATIDGLTRCLAALAGAFDYASPDDLVSAARADWEPGAVAASIPQAGTARAAKADAIAGILAGPDDDEPDDADEAAPRSWRDEPWQPTGAIREAYIQAELDTQAEPMGGWEPRS